MEVGFQDEPLPKVDVYGPYEAEEGEVELKSKKKKKSKKTSKELLDGEAVKKKKNSKRQTEDGLKREKQSKRRSSNVNIDPQSSQTDADMNQHETQKYNRASANGPMSCLSGGANSLAHIAPARLESVTANGVPRSMPQSAGLTYTAAFDERTNSQTPQQERTIDGETSDGMDNSDDNHLSVITPLAPFEREPSLRDLREDVEDGFVPVETRFSSTSPPGKSERVRHRIYWEEPRQGSEFSKLNRERRSSEPPNLDSKLSPDEKKRVSLPSSLIPNQEKDHAGQLQQQKRKNGPLSLFPVDESYDTGRGATTHEKSSHRLSYSSTGESYAQLETENGAQGGTVDYVATRRLTTKDIRRKENREGGPSYFASSEQYNDENIRANTQMPSPLDVEARLSDRAGAFSIRRPGLLGSNQDWNLSRAWMPEVDQGEQMTQVASEQHAVVASASGVRMDTESGETAEYKLTAWYCSCWFKVLATLVLIAAIAAAIAIPLISSKDDDSVSFTRDQIVARMERFLPVLTSVSNETELMNATSPQGAALA